MSISKRFVSMLKSNLNSLLDKTAAAEGGGADGGRRLEDLSDSELEAELQRRQARREAAQEAARRAAAGGVGGGGGAGSTRAPRGADAEAWQEVEDTLRGSRYRTTGRRPSRSYERVNRRRTSGSSEEARLARLYAQLECPNGANMDVVRKQYRIMMRKYHPDMHSGDAEKQRLATELSQRLTQAYNDLRRSLSGP